MEQVVRAFDYGRWFILVLTLEDRVAHTRSESGSCRQTDAYASVQVVGS